MRIRLNNGAQMQFPVGASMEIYDNDGLYTIVNDTDAPATLASSAAEPNPGGTLAIIWARGRNQAMLSELLKNGQLRQ